MTLEELQNRWLESTHMSRAVVDNDESALWTLHSHALINLIGLRMARGEEGHPEWASSPSPGRTELGPDHVAVEFSQQLIRTPIGYVGTGRYTLRLGPADDCVTYTSHNKSLLRASLDAYLAKQQITPEFRAQCERLIQID